MKSLFVSLLLLFLGTFSEASEKPNIVIILLDDAGWSDFHPFGKPPYPTPHVQELADQGARFNNFYVPQSSCSASRSGLLTGSYPGRTGVFGAHAPNALGLPTKFPTLAELLKNAGYSTAHFGKWHIGDRPETRPLSRGFDEHAGLMYSNDMWRFHPVNPKKWGQFPLKFWENGKVKIRDISKKDQEQLTTWATQKSVDFIKRNKDKPFFLYVAHSMPHVPLFCSKKFLGKSTVGLYGDVIMEIDWSVGQIHKAIKESGIERKTMVIFTSDNGPWTLYGNHGGKTPYRGAKGTSFDGGIKSPLIIKYPPLIKAGNVSNSTFFSIDLFPTIAKLSGAKLPTSEIDGKDITPLLTMKKNARSPQKYYAITMNKNLEAIMSGDGRWKLHLPHKYRKVALEGKSGNAGQYVHPKMKLSLYDLKNDPYEKNNVIENHPAIAKKLKNWAFTHLKKFYK